MATLTGQVLWSGVLMFIDQPWTLKGRPVLLLSPTSDVVSCFVISLWQLHPGEKTEIPPRWITNTETL